MKATLSLNHKDQLALFYNEPLSFTPEWASIDIERGDIYLGGRDTESQPINLDVMDHSIYGRVRQEGQILLVLLSKEPGHEVLHAVFVPLMISQQC